MSRKRFFFVLFCLLRFFCVWFPFLCFFFFYVVVVYAFLKVEICIKVKNIINWYPSHYYIDYHHCPPFCYPFYFYYCYYLKKMISNCLILLLILLLLLPSQLLPRMMNSKNHLTNITVIAELEYHYQQKLPYQVFHLP